MPNDERTDCRVAFLCDPQLALAGQAAYARDGPRAAGPRLVTPLARLTTRHGPRDGLVEEREQRDLVVGSPLTNADQRAGHGALGCIDSRPSRGPRESIMTRSRAAPRTRHAPVRRSLRGASPRADLVRQDIRGVKRGNDGIPRHATHDLTYPFATLGRRNQQGIGPARRSSTASPVVDVSPVAKRDDYDHEHIVGHGVDDAVVPDSHAQARSSAQSTRRRRTWVLREQRDDALDAAADLWIELAQRTDGGRSQLDAISAHSQPRSAFACSQGMFGPSSAIAASNAAASSASSSAAISRA